MGCMIVCVCEVSDHFEISFFFPLLSSLSPSHSIVQGGWLWELGHRELPDGGNSLGSHQMPVQPALHLCGDSAATQRSGKCRAGGGEGTGLATRLLPAALRSSQSLRVMKGGRGRSSLTPGAQASRSFSENGTAERV